MLRPLYGAGVALWKYWLSLCGIGFLSPSTTASVVVTVVEGASVALWSTSGSVVANLLEKWPHFFFLYITFCELELALYRDWGFIG